MCFLGHRDDIDEQYGAFDIYFDERQVIDLTLGLDDELLHRARSWS